ncbi:MAG TPA: lysylphosphatidylglycerol synthase domain-containing protein [Candidatus Latescibacteria bacterium]|nr:lysylphosphatidylglycerol synthase domain-containing protein [Candidatus Latescibacterota bacterium]
MNRRTRSRHPSSDEGLKCIIIAAGRGSRLADIAPSKPLLKVAGEPLISRAIEAARGAGVREFVVVTGYAGDEVEKYVQAKAAEDGISIATVRNEEWEKENGLSVLKAEGLSGGRFFLVMADHIVDARLLDELRRQPIGDDEVILAVDARITGHPFVDLDDVTRVRHEDGRIAAIGKNIPVFNAFDTGVFLCTPALFAALEDSQRRGDYSLSGGIRILAEKGKARTWEIGDRFWIDVDDEQALRKAEDVFAAGRVARVGGRGSVRGSRLSWKGTRVALSVAGLLLFVYLISKVGTGTVLVQLARFGPWFLAIVALALAGLFVQACAWHLILAAHFRPVPLLRLFKTKIISDALNTLIPSASVGGDAARAFMLRKHLPLKEGIPGVLVDKTIEFSASVFFLMTGFLLSLLFLDLPGWMTGAAVTCLGATLVGIALLIALQMKGVFWTLGKISKVFPKVRRFAAKREGQLKDLDESLRLVYMKLEPRTALAGVLHYFARLLGVFEVFVIFRVLGAPASFIQAFFTATGVTMINTAFFIVPGHFGVMESAHILIVRSLGFTAALGLSVGVIRRIRKLATIAVALFVFALSKERD